MTVATDVAADCPLSQIQLELITLAADGLTKEEIGRTTFRTTHTVKTHLRRAADKLDLQGPRATTALVATCLRRGWIR